MVFSLIIGGGTPPVGVLLFIAQDIAGISFSKMVRAMLPYYIPLFAAVVIIALFPESEPVDPQHGFRRGDAVSARFPFLDTRF